MKILLITFFILLLSSFLPNEIFAAVDCNNPANKQNVECVFGTIKPPKELIPFTSPDPSGAGGISKFLTNLVGLIYSLAAIVLIFMILWGAFDWMTSGGEKEKIESARNKIISAIIGIMLFAVAFAVIKVLGQFTGFQFFTSNQRGTTPLTHSNDLCWNNVYKPCIDRAGGIDNASEQSQIKCNNEYQDCTIANP